MRAGRRGWRRSSGACPCRGSAGSRQNAFRRCRGRGLRHPRATARATRRRRSSWRRGTRRRTWAAPRERRGKGGGGCRGGHGGAGGELAACRFTTLEHGGNVGVVHVEYVVEQEGGALERGEALEREQQGDREVFGERRGRLGDERLGQPRADVELAARGRGLHA